MFNVRLAGLVIGIDNKYPYIKDMCAGYITDAPAVFDVSVSAEQILSEAEHEPRLDSDMGYLETLAVYRAIAEKLLDYDGFLLHSAVICAHKRGIAFAARSGTGKTTHLRLWKKMLGDACSVINGDKPLIRLTDGVPYAYGTPWAGKEGYNTNDKARLYDLCFLTRSTENYISAIDTSDAVKRLFCQIYMPGNPMLKIKTLELMNLFMQKVRVWEIGCNMDISAAETVYRKLFEVK